MGANLPDVGGAGPSERQASTPMAVADSAAELGLATPRAKRAFDSLSGGVTVISSAESPYSVAGGIAFASASSPSVAALQAASPPRKRLQHASSSSDPPGNGGTGVVAVSLRSVAVVHAVASPLRQRSREELWRKAAESASSGEAALTDALSSSHPRRGEQ